MGIRTDLLAMFILCYQLVTNAHKNILRIYYMNFYLFYLSRIIIVYILCYISHFQNMTV